MKRKKILIISFSHTKGEPQEIMSIMALAELLNFQIVRYPPPTNTADLDRMLQENHDVDYLYLGGHGDEDCISNNREFQHKISLRWNELGSMLREYGTMTKDKGILLLACCQGGQKSISDTLFKECKSIVFVIGSNKNLTSLDTLMSFSTLFYNLIVRGQGHEVACTSLNAGFDLDFMCHRRKGFDENSMREDEEESENRKNGIFTNLY